ncbi:MAG TPA: hypothetical protein VMS88_01105 [Terriglobales bacterium]|nr:hypothetical protein [Terriglobales bacterium]
MKRARALPLALVFLLCLSVAFPIVYNIISEVDVHGTALADSWAYIEIYKGTSLETIAQPFRYRLFTPYLARLVPAPPRSAAVLYDLAAEKVIKFRFGMVDALCLAGAGLFLFLLCEALGLPAVESLLGSVLFLGGHAVINYAGGPMTDAASYLFLCAAILCALRNWRWGLFLSVLVGMLAKETTGYVLAPILFLPTPARDRIAKVLLCLPGILIYLGFRLTVRAASPHDFAIGNPFVNVWERLHSARRMLFTGIEGWLAFGVVWVFAVWGFWILARRGSWRSPILRLAVLVPVAVAMPILLDANVARMSYLAFPAVIPLALVAVDRLFGDARRTGEPAAAGGGASP